MSSARRSRDEPSLRPGSRICVVLLTGIGDVVHGLPIVNPLKAHDRSCHMERVQRAVSRWSR